MALSTDFNIQITPIETVAFADTTTTAKTVDSLIDKVIALSLPITSVDEVSRYYHAAKPITSSGQSLVTLTSVANSFLLGLYINNPKYACTVYQTGDTAGVVIPIGGCLLIINPTTDVLSMATTGVLIKSANATDTIELFVVMGAAK